MQMRTLQGDLVNHLYSQVEFLPGQLEPYKSTCIPKSTLCQVDLIKSYKATCIAKST